MDALLHRGLKKGNSTHHRRRRRGHRRSPRRHFRNRQRAAVVRAVTAGRLYASGAVSTLAAAAIACGSNVAYVAAAVTLLKSENNVLLDRALHGATPLLAAASEVGAVARLVSAYRGAGSDDLAAFTRTIGVANVWDQILVPVL
jgi:hypothetical protein